MRKFLVIVFCIAGFLVKIQAQSATATLSGTVVDEQNAAVSGATVTLIDAAKTFERT